MRAWIAGVVLFSGCLRHEMAKAYVDDRDSAPARVASRRFESRPRLLLGDPNGAFYRTALQLLVVRGFDVSIATPAAGYIKASRRLSDPETADGLERSRLEIWDSMTPGEKLVLLQRTDPEARELVSGGATCSRAMTVSIVATPERTVITPSVVICIERRSGVSRCGPVQATLTEAEEAVLVELSAAAPQPASTPTAGAKQETPWKSFDETGTTAAPPPDR